MRHVILFSGGFDSTYLLYKFVEAKNKAISNGRKEPILSPGFFQDGVCIHPDDIIVALSIHHKDCGSESQRKKEVYAREKIITHLSNTYPKIKIDRLQIDVSIDECNSGYLKRIHSLGKMGLYQPIIWMCSSLPFMESGDQVYFSYIADDEAPVFINEINRIIENCGIIMGVEKPISVHFPLRLKAKTEIIYSLYKDGGETLFEYAVSCEGFCTDIKFCGGCTPCTHLQTALILLTISGTKSEVDFASKYIKKYFPETVDTMLTRLQLWSQSKEGGETCEKERNQENPQQSNQIDAEEGCYNPTGRGDF